MVDMACCYRPLNTLKSLTISSECAIHLTMSVVVFQNAQHQTVVLNKTTERADLPGVSVKAMYRDPQGNGYILKDVKQRTLSTILGKEYAQKLFADYAALCSENPDDVNIVTNALLTMLTQGLFDIPIADLTDEYLAVIFETRTKELLSQLTALGDAEKIKRILKQVQEKVPELRSHVSQTLCNFMHTEILGPCVVKAIWGEAVVAPETFYPNEYDPLNPQIISRFLTPSEDENEQLQRFIEFLQPKITAYAEQKLNRLDGNVRREFISKHSRGNPNHYFDLQPFLIRSPHFWRKLQKAGVPKPRLKDLDLRAYQRRIMGKLYAIALVTGHVDILNNIDGTNSGSMMGLPACVDWGNSFNIGFGGLSKDESFLAWDRAESVSKTIVENDPETLQKMWSNPHKNSLFSESYCFPFVEQVFPFIPRLLVQDIFNLDDPDIFHGFVEFIHLAHENLNKVDEGFQRAWPNEPAIQATLNHAWFSPEGEGPPIIKARIKQLERIVRTIPADCKEPQALLQQALLQDVKSFMEHQEKPKIKPC